MVNKIWVDEISKCFEENILQKKSDKHKHKMVLIEGNYDKRCISYIIILTKPPPI